MSRYPISCICLVKGIRRISCTYSAKKLRDPISCNLLANDEMYKSSVVSKSSNTTLHYRNQSHKRAKVGFHLKCVLLLSDFNPKQNVSKNLVTINAKF